jgi:hypothetical protein
MPIEFLKRLLCECEMEHKRQGHPAETWATWYAAYMSPRIAEWHVATYGGFAGVACPYFAARPDVREFDGITEG